MTVDSNHLRGLLAASSLRDLSVEWTGRTATVYSGQSPNAHGFNLFGRLEPDRNGPANLEAFVALCNNASELLDRSDALDEALRLLRCMPLDDDYYDEETIAELEQRRRVFLSRFPQEAVA